MTQQEQPHSIYYNPQLTTVLLRLLRFPKVVETNLSKKKFIGKILQDYGLSGNLKNHAQKRARTKTFLQNQET